MRRLLLVSVAAVLAGCAVMGPPAVPTTNTFIVFFESTSAGLTPEAQKEIDLAAVKIKAVHPSHVLIAVYSKATTANPGNPTLADPRYDAVAAALVADGVDPHLIAPTELTNLDVQAGSAGNRRVEIHLAND